MLILDTMSNTVENISVNQFYSNSDTAVQHSEGLLEDASTSLVHNVLIGLPDDAFSEFFDVQDTVSWILEHNFKRVALQFPDQFIRFACRIVKHLETATSAKVFILADTSYRSCCVDEVAAAHSNCDSLVHYGEACLSAPTEKIAVRYVLGRLPVCVNSFKEKVIDSLDQQRPYLVVADSAYSHAIGTLTDSIRQSLPGIQLISAEIPSLTLNNYEERSESDHVMSLGRRIPSSISSLEDVVVIFIGGPDSPFLPLWLMTYPQCSTVIQFDPLNNTTCRESAQSTRQLRKRLFLVEKLRDANTVGLVVGSVGVKGHKESVLRMRELCKTAGKKVYVISVGKVNVPKLSNFSDIDCFVLLSCPFGVVLDTSSHFRPLLSLFEAEVALNPSANWMASHGWTADFSRFINDPIGVQSSDDGADVSLITGKVRARREMEEGGDAEKRDGQVALYTAGDYFAERSWRGLDDSVRAGESIEVSEGKRGVAQGYCNENDN